MNQIKEPSTVGTLEELEEIEKSLEQLRIKIKSQKTLC